MAVDISCQLVLVHCILIVLFLLLSRHSCFVVAATPEELAAEYARTTRYIRLPQAFQIRQAEWDPDTETFIVASLGAKRIFRVFPTTSTAQTIAGTGASEPNGAITTPLNAALSNPIGVALFFDSSGYRIGYAYSLEAQHTVAIHNLTSNLLSPAGCGSIASSGDTDGDCSSLAKFKNPHGLSAFRRSGLGLSSPVTAVADKGNNLIRAMYYTTSGTLSLRKLAGTGAATSEDGTGDVATFNGPTAVGCYPKKNANGVRLAIFVSESTGGRLRRILLGGATPADHIVTTVAALSTGTGWGVFVHDIHNSDPRGVTAQLIWWTSSQRVVRFRINKIVAEATTTVGATQPPWNRDNAFGGDSCLDPFVTWPFVLENGTICGTRDTASVDASGTSIVCVPWSICTVRTRTQTLVENTSSTGTTTTATSAATTSTTATTTTTLASTTATTTSTIAAATTTSAATSMASSSSTEPPSSTTTTTTATMTSTATSTESSSSTTESTTVSLTAESTPALTSTETTAGVTSATTTTTTATTTTTTATTVSTEEPTKPSSTSTSTEIPTSPSPMVTSSSTVTTSTLFFTTRPAQQTTTTTSSSSSSTPTTTTLSTTTTTTTTSTTTRAPPRRSRTRTSTITLPIPPTPAPTLPAVVVVARKTADATAAVAAASGAGALAVQQARLNAVTSLIDCGAVGNRGEEPDFISSPLNMQLGSGPLSWSRGVMVGNVVFVVASFAVGYTIVLIHSIVAKERFKHACYRLRMPGVISIVAAVLLPPSSEHAVVLLLFGDGGADVAYAVCGGFFLVLVPIVVTGFIGHQCSSGRVVLHFTGPLQQQQQRGNKDSQENTKQQRCTKQQQQQGEENQVPDDETFEADGFFHRKCPRFAKTELFKKLMWLSEIEWEYLDSRDWIGSNNDESTMMKSRLVQDNEREIVLEGSLLQHPADTEMEEIRQNERSGRKQQQLDRRELRELSRGDRSLAAALVGTNGVANEDAEDVANAVAATSSSSSMSSTLRVIEGGLKNRPDAAQSMAEGNDNAVLDFLIANPFFSKYGVIFEDFNNYYFSIVDLVVSGTLGVTAGVASGVVTRLWCIILFFVSMFACSVHMYLLLRKRCVTPRFVYFYVTLGSFVTLLAIVLSFVGYLGAALERNDAFAALGLTQAGLGICAAIAAFIGVFNFLYQMGDAYFISKKREGRKRKGILETAKRSGDGNGGSSLPQGSERNVVFEFDFLSHLDSEINNGTGENGNSSGEGDNLFSNLEEELRALAATSADALVNANVHNHSNNRNNDNDNDDDDDGDDDLFGIDLNENEKNGNSSSSNSRNINTTSSPPSQQQQQKQTRPDLNHLLDDSDDAVTCIRRRGGSATRTKLGPDGEMLFVLDDDDDDGEGATIVNDLKRSVETGGRNAELEMRQEELAKFLRGEIVV